MAVTPISTSTSYPLFGTNVGPFGTVWPFEIPADVQVWLTLPPAAARLLASGPDYTLTGATPLVSGGQITLDGSLPGAGWGAGAMLSIRRATSNDQPSAFGEALGFSPQANEFALDHVERQLQDIRTSLALLGAGGGGGGASDWSQITNIPAVWPGQVAWSSITGRPGAWPGTLPFGSLTSVPADWPGTLPYGSLTGLPALIDAIDGLTPANGKIIEFTGPTTAHLINTPSGGGGGGGSMRPQELSAFGTVDATGANPTTNDPTIAAAEVAADVAVYLRDGMYAKSIVAPPFSNLTKAYEGRGRWKESTSILPANFAYMAAKPTTPATQGLTGWWDGDNRFNDGGEYKIVGAAVRTFDLAGPARYFEENTIPHPVWMDVLGGNSGCSAFLTAGAASGATVIALPFAADASWVGKTVGFADSYGGSIVESHVINAVNTAGNNITLATALTNTYTFSPLTGHAPNLVFHLRTSASWHYSKMTHAGGGDAYNLVLRQNVNYVGWPTQTHPFMKATAGNLGGDTYFNADGVFGQNQEWQLQHQTYDVAAISYVFSGTRAKDDRLDSVVALGTYFKFDGGRPYDVAHCVAGTVRNAFDTGFATLYETSLLTANAPAGTSTFTVKSTNGAHPGDPVVLGSETLTIQNVVSGTSFTTTTACIGNYVIGNLVSYTVGGAALNMAFGQRIIWNSGLSQNARGGDPTNVFSNFYGNVQGDLIMESTTAGGVQAWQVRFARGTTAAAPDTARLRLKPTGMNLFGTGHTIAGNLGMAAASQINMSLSVPITWGGVQIMGDGAHLYASINGGGSYTLLL